MKLNDVRLRSDVNRPGKGPTESTSYFKGGEVELSLADGMVTVRDARSGARTLVPLSNVICLTPAAEDEKAAPRK